MSADHDIVMMQQRRTFVGNSLCKCCCCCCLVTIWCEDGRDISPLLVYAAWRSDFISFSSRELLTVNSSRRCAHKPHNALPTLAEYSLPSENKYNQVLKTFHLHLLTCYKVEFQIYQNHRKLNITLHISQCSGSKCFTLWCIDATEKALVYIHT